MNANVINFHISAIIPTRNRAKVLARTLVSLESQGPVPAELIVIDASDDDASKKVVAEFSERTSGRCLVRWIAAEIPGAAVQRNQGMVFSTQPIIAFLDDDILFETHCFERLLAALESAPDIGGVSAMITNQRYQTPGLPSRWVYWLFKGCAVSYAGRVLGPAVNLLPEDRDDLPEIVSVEWMNLGCTLYRKRALPDPPFPAHFSGYSIMEDLTLSLTVAREWKLFNARTARIFHDTQPGLHKSNFCDMAKMDTVNRHYVMTHVLGRNLASDYCKLIFWQLFTMFGSLRNGTGWSEFHLIIRGRLQGWRQILFGSIPHE
jgi:glycosyltransferase involved in cell wall biosynthesis